MFAQSTKSRWNWADDSKWCFCWLRAFCCRHEWNVSPQNRLAPNSAWWRRFGHDAAPDLQNLPGQYRNDLFFPNILEAQTFETTQFPNFSQVCAEDLVTYQLIKVQQVLFCYCNCWLSLHTDTFLFFTLFCTFFVIRLPQTLCFFGFLHVNMLLFQEVPSSFFLCKTD